MQRAITNAAAFVRVWPRCEPSGFMFGTIHTVAAARSAAAPAPSPRSAATPLADAAPTPEGTTAVVLETRVRITETRVRITATRVRTRAIRVRITETRVRITEVSSAHRASGAAALRRTTRPSSRSGAADTRPARMCARAHEYAHAHAYMHTHAQTSARAHAQCRRAQAHPQHSRQAVVRWAGRDERRMGLETNAVDRPAVGGRAESVDGTPGRGGLSTPGGGGGRIACTNTHARTQPHTQTHARRHALTRALAYARTHTRTRLRTRANLWCDDARSMSRACRASGYGAQYAYLSNLQP